MPPRSDAAGYRTCAVAARVLTAGPLLPAANDDLPHFAAPDHGSYGPEQPLRAALRHWTLHGRGATERARDNAHQAFAGGRPSEYRHWMAIWRLLDQDLACPAPAAGRS